MVRNTGTIPTEEELQEESQQHAALGRRERFAAIERQYKGVPVANGTQQSGAIHKLTDHYIKLAQMTEELCADGPEKRIALENLHSAKLHAIHSISHR